jgi:hypothetical protein
MPVCIVITRQSLKNYKKIHTQKKLQKLKWGSKNCSSNTEEGREGGKEGGKQTESEQ